MARKIKIRHEEIGDATKPHLRQFAKVKDLNADPNRKPITGKLWGTKHGMPLPKWARPDGEEGKQ